MTTTSQQQPPAAASPTSYTSVVDVLLLLVRDSAVLLALRSGTGYADGQWNVPSGKLEHGEHVLEAAVREAREEVGLDLDPRRLRLAVTLHNINAEGQARLGLFFEVDDWTGEPHNAEPDKCAQLAWHPLTALPKNTVPYTSSGVSHFLRREPLGLNGWGR